MRPDRFEFYFRCSCGEALEIAMEVNRVDHTTELSLKPCKNCLLIAKAEALEATLQIPEKRGD